MEKVEGAFGSSVQQILQIRWVEIQMTDVDVLSALSSRAQRGPVIRSLLLHNVGCGSLNFAKLFLNLLRSVGKVGVLCGLMPKGMFLTSKLTVLGDVGREGWQVLGDALSLHPGVFNNVSTSKEVILCAQKEDLQKIHLALRGTRKNWSVIEEGRCILHGNRSSFDDWRGVGETATKKENNKEWELLEEFLAKAQGTREEGLE